MIMSDTMLIGLGIVAVGTLAGVIGTLLDTKNKAGLKGFLVLLILGAGGAGVYTEYQREDVAKSEQKRSEEALRMAKESGRLAEEEMLKNELFRQKMIDEKDKLLADRKKNAQITEMFADTLMELSSKVEALEDAAAKARKKDIAEAGEEARAEVSKKLLALAKENQWLGVTDSAKMEKTVDKGDPLSSKDIKVIRGKLKEQLEKSPIEETP